MDEQTNIQGIKTNTIDFYNSKYLAEQLRARYAFIDRPRLGLSKVVMDSYLPQILYRYNMDYNAIKTNIILPNTAVAISETAANLLGIKQIPINELYQILGYEKKQLLELFRKVKNKRMIFIMAGAGGVGMNTLHWLSKLLEHLNLPYLFDRILIAEEDDIEVSNLYRFPFDINNYNLPVTPPNAIGNSGNNSMFSVINNFIQPNSNIELSKTYLKNTDNKVLTDIYNEIKNNDKKKSYLAESFEYFDRNNSIYHYTTTKLNVAKQIAYKLVDTSKNKYKVKAIATFIPNFNRYNKYPTLDSTYKTPYLNKLQDYSSYRDRFVVYGAPDLQSRNLLSEEVGNFLCATHADNNCSIMLNPTLEDTSLQVESYGMIQLGSFFMNQLKMAISLVEILANDSINLQEKDVTLLDYEFTGEYNRKKAKCNYNWIIDNNARMRTEAEANALGDI